MTSEADSQDRWAEAGLLFRRHGSYDRHLEKRMVHFPLALWLQTRERDQRPTELGDGRWLALNSFFVSLDGTGRRRSRDRTAVDTLAIDPRGRVLLIEAKLRANDVEAALQQLDRYIVLLRRSASRPGWLPRLFHQTYSRASAMGPHARKPQPYEKTLDATLGLQDEMQRTQWEEAVDAQLLSESGRPLAAVALAVDKARLRAMHTDLERLLTKWIQHTRPGPSWQALALGVCHSAGRPEGRTEVAVLAGRG